MVKQNNVSRIHDAYIEQYQAQMKRRQKRKKRLVRRLALFAVVVMITMTGLTTYHLDQRAKLKDMEQEYTELSNQLTTLKQEEEQLTEEIELLNDEEYLLQIAKTNYFFTEKGEIIFKLPEEEPSY
ncbi:septum formation initiator family protein [Gracilibacillus sp. YIM 98692]|uniref:septum formation initiator family protein n=1 Tax=Gracilibacillus sp. YIM 98692 TaxID=2663532 RepID=UPI0013D26997|nr:septum formation initiator family protein [Gracilibacillus sp. YIM 98692]